MQPQNRTRTQTKFKLKSGFKPDAGIISAITSMKQNPKFSRLLGFSMNCLMPHLTPPNPRHRDNVNYLISEGGHTNIIRALTDHVKDDNILFNATQLLMKIVGRDKFKDEEMARIIVDSGAVTALMGALNDPSEKSKHTIKAIIELLNILGVNPNLASKMIDQGVLETMTKTLTKLNLTENVVKNGIEALQKITSHPQAKTALISRNIIKDIVALLEKKSYSPVIVQSGLKLLESISRTKEGVEYLKKDGLGMRAMVTLLEKHPEERAILNIGANILGKIATVADLDQALATLKSGDPHKAHISAAILSSLTLVDDMMEEIIKKNVVFDMIEIIKKSTQSKVLSSEDQRSLIKHCAIAIGRVAEVDARQITDLIDKGGLETLNAAIELKDPEVIASCVNTLAKISQNDEVLPKLAKAGCIKKVLNAAKEFMNEGKICESTINLLENLATDDTIIEEIAASGGLAIIVSMMKKNPDDKKIVEQGTRTLGLLSINEANATEIIENGIVEFLIDSTNKHPEWRKCAFYAVNLIDGLSEMEQVVPVLKKNNGLQAVISILSGKNFSEKKEENPNANNNEEKNFEEEEKDVTNEVLNPKQEIELRDSGLAVLEKLVGPEEILSMKKSLETTLVELNKRPDAKNANEMEAKVATLSYLAQVPALGEQILKDDVTAPLIDFSKKVNGMKEFDGKSALVSQMVNFFNNMSYLNTRESTRELYQKKKLGQNFIAFVNDVLEKNSEPMQVIQGLKSLKSFLNQKTGDIANAANKRNSKRLSLLDVAASRENSQMIEKMLDGIIGNMKKYPDNEELQLNALEVFNTMSQLSPELNSSIVKMGGSRYIIGKLEEDLTSKKVGIQCLKLLNNLASAKKDAILLLNNQKAGEAIMSFLTNQRNDSQCSEAAAPVLKLLASAENSEFTKEMEKDIQELVQTIDPNVKNATYDPINACESLEILNNFALLEKTIPSILKNGAIASISHLMTHELKEDESVLAEKGLLTLNERLLYSALGNINQLINSPQALKSSVFDDIVKNDIAKNLIDCLKARSNNATVVEKALEVTNSLINNDKTRDNMIKALIKGDIVDNLTDFVEKFNESPEITHFANNLLFNLTKASPEIATKLSKQNFVRNLIKETKNNLKDSNNNEESLRLTKQNLQCLSVLAEIGQTAEKLISEGGVEFSSLILKKENQLSPLIPDEEVYYQLNLASEEQELEKKLAAVKEGALQENYEEDEKSISYYAAKLLNQQIKDPKMAGKLLNEDSIREVLNAIQINPGDRDLAMTALNLLNKASQNEKLAKIIQNNNGINAVFTVINQRPTDMELIELSGEVLNNLGCDQTIEKVKANVAKIGSNLKNTEKELNELVKSNVYLANLLAMPPVENEATVLESNKAVIKAIEKTLLVSLENPELLASNLLLISRLANQGEGTKELIRESSIPKIILKEIVPNSDIMKPEHGKISELALNSLESMVGGSEEYIKMLDPKKGKTVEVLTKEEKLKNLGNGLSELLMANDADLLEEVLNIAELKGTNSDKPHSIKTIEKAANFMAKLCENDPSLAAALLNKGGVSKLKSLYEDIAKRNVQGNIKESPIKKVGKLLAALSKTPAGFQAIVKETGILEQLIDDLNAAKINQDMDKDLDSLKTLDEGLKTLEKLLDNDFDKSEFIELKVPECVTGLIQRFNQLPVNYIQEHENIGESLNNLSKVLNKLAKDPALSRILAKADGANTLMDCLDKSKELSKEDLGLKDPANKPNNKEDIIGSEALNDRIIENTLEAVLEFSNNAKNAEKLEFLHENKRLQGDLKDIMTNKAQNPVIVTSGLKIIENCLKTSNPEQLKLANKDLKELSEFSAKMVSQFPKIPLIASLAKNISTIAKSLDAESLKLEQKAVAKGEITKIADDMIFEAKKQVAEQAKIENLMLETKKLEIQPNKIEEISSNIEEIVPIEKKIITVANSSELMTKLDLVADSLEDFLNKTTKSSKMEEEDMGKLVLAIGNFAGGGKTAQLHNMGVTDGLIGLISSANVSENLKSEALDSLNKLTKDQKLVEKMAESDKLASTIAKGLFEHSKKKLNQLQKGMVNNALEAAGNLANNETTLKQFKNEGGIKAIIEMMKNNKENPEILSKCADSLTRLAVNDDIVKEIIDLGGLELVEELYKKYPDLLEFLRAFAGLVAKLAVNEQAKNKLGSGLVITIIVEGVKMFMDDLILGLNSCLALGNLSYAHSKNSEAVIKTEFITYTHNYVKKMMKEAQLMANVGSFFNSLAFKNSPNKKELGKKGVMDDLQKVFEAYTSERDLKLDTLKQCFKAIGNISLFLENASKIIRAGFVQSACSFIRSNINVTELVKFALDIFANMASFPEEINDINLQGMITQGAIETILNCIQENSLNSDVLNSAINALDYLCMNKSIRLIVAEKDGVAIVVKILKSQDWNQNLVIKCLRILSNLASAKENVEVLINNKVHNTIVDIMTVQKKEENIIFQCFKLSAKLAIDKPFCKIVYQSGFVHSAYEVLDELQLNTESVLELLGILGTLAKFCDEASQAICQKGSASLIQTINTKIVDVKLMKKAAALMEYLLYLQRNADLITQNRGIEALNLLLDKHTKDDDIDLASFKSLSSIALASEDYRKMCLEQKCIDFIKKIIEHPVTKEGVVTEGKLTINTILASKVEIPPEEELNLKKFDSKVTKEIKNFLVGGKICRLYKKDGSSKEMHIFMTPDLKELMAKRPKNQGIKQQWRLPIHQIRETIFEYKDKNKYSQSVFAKSGGLFKKKAEQELCFSLIGPVSLEGQRVLHIESANLIEKKKWVEAIAAVLEDYKKQSKHKN